MVLEAILLFLALTSLWVLRANTKRHEEIQSILKSEIGRLRKANQEQAAIIREYELYDDGKWQRQVQAWWDDE